MRHFPTYKLDDRLRLVPGKDTPTVNFAWLKETLLSKDLSQADALSWAKEGLRFLDGSVDMAGNRICFASYPRTGNTMTRTTIEAITGIYTGSDMNLLQTSMMHSIGIAGEEHTCDDNTVWVGKTHWPIPPAPIIPQKEFTMDKAFVITRNFIDVLPSLFLLQNTASHSLTAPGKLNELFPEEWDAWIKFYVPRFRAYHDYFINELPKEVPVYFLRYEDQDNQAETTNELFRFMLD